LSVQSSPQLYSAPKCGDIFAKCLDRYGHSAFAIEQNDIFTFLMLMLFVLVDSSFLIAPFVSCFKYTSNFAG